MSELKNGGSWSVDHWDTDLFLFVEKDGKKIQLKFNCNEAAQLYLAINFRLPEMKQAVKNTKVKGKLI